jgi:hypothetical protein
VYRHESQPQSSCKKKNLVTGANKAVSCAACALHTTSNTTEHNYVIHSQSITHSEDGVAYWHVQRRIMPKGRSANRTRIALLRRIGCCSSRRRKQLNPADLCVMGQLIYARSQNNHHNHIDVVIALFVTHCELLSEPESKEGTFEHLLRRPGSRDFSLTVFKAKILHRRLFLEPRIRSSRNVVCLTTYAVVFLAVVFIVSRAGLHLVQSSSTSTTTTISDLAMNK